MNTYNVCGIIFKQENCIGNDVLWGKFEVYRKDIQSVMFQIFELKKIGFFHCYEVYGKVQGYIVKLYDEMFLISNDYRYGWILESSIQKDRIWCILYLFYTHAGV